MWFIEMWLSKNNDWRKLRFWSRCNYATFIGTILSSNEDEQSGYSRGIERKKNIDTYNIVSEHHAVIFTFISWGSFAHLPEWDF